MSRQASAERKRREDVLHAEALKKSQILESEGLKQKLINESEGKKIKIENEAIAEANAIKIRGDAMRYATIKNAEGLAETLRIVGEELSKETGKSAAEIQLASKYIEEFGKIVEKSNSLIIPSNINDISGVVANAMKISELISKAKI